MFLSPALFLSVCYLHCSSAHGTDFDPHSLLVLRCVYSFQDEELESRELYLMKEVRRCVFVAATTPDTKILYVCLLACGFPFSIVNVNGWALNGYLVLYTLLFREWKGVKTRCVSRDDTEFACGETVPQMAGLRGVLSLFVVAIVWTVLKFGSLYLSLEASR